MSDHCDFRAAQVGALLGFWSTEGLGSFVFFCVLVWGCGLEGVVLFPFVLFLGKTKQKPNKSQ